MQISEAISLFEDSLKHFGLTPEQTRCEQPGEYLISRDKTEIYVDIWQPETASQWQYFDRQEVAGVFQVVAPICKYPDDAALTMFLEELAHLNFHLFFGRFIANGDQKMISIQYKRILEGLNETEIVEPIEAIGYYAENLKEYLHEKYKVEKI
jgi:hypothetical protein